MDQRLINILAVVDTEELLAKNNQDFANALINDMKLFLSEKDFKLFVLEKMQEAFKDGASWPIRYKEDSDVEE